MSWLMVERAPVVDVGAPVFAPPESDGETSGS
jgi:hypothetical protein